MLLSTSFDDPLYRYETLRYLSSTVYLKPDSKRMREIFYIIFFFLFLISRSECLVSIELVPTSRISYSESRLVTGIPAAINTPSTWHARQGGADREPPHWFQRWNQFYSTVTLHILIYTRGQPPVWLSAETEEEGWRVVMGSSGTDPRQIWSRKESSVIFFETNARQFLSNFRIEYLVHNDREKYIVEFKL